MKLIIMLGFLSVLKIDKHLFKLSMMDKDVAYCNCKININILANLDYRTNSKPTYLRRRNLYINYNRGQRGFTELSWMINSVRIKNYQLQCSCKFKNPFYFTLNFRCKRLSRDRLLKAQYF